MEPAVKRLGLPVVEPLVRRPGTAQGFVEQPGPGLKRLEAGGEGPHRRVVLLRQMGGQMIVDPVHQRGGVLGLDRLERAHEKMAGHPGVHEVLLVDFDVFAFRVHPPVPVQGEEHSVEQVDFVGLAGDRIPEAMEALAGGGRRGRAAGHHQQVGLVGYGFQRPLPGPAVGIVHPRRVDPAQMGRSAGKGRVDPADLGRRRSRQPLPAILGVSGQGAPVGHPVPQLGKGTPGHGRSVEILAAFVEPVLENPQVPEDGVGGGPGGNFFQRRQQEGREFVGGFRGKQGFALRFRQRLGHGLQGGAEHLLQEFRLGVEIQIEVGAVLGVVDFAADRRGPLVEGGQGLDSGEGFQKGGLPRLFQPGDGNGDEPFGEPIPPEPGPLFQGRRLGLQPGQLVGPVPQRGGFQSVQGVQRGRNRRQPLPQQAAGGNRAFQIGGPLLPGADDGFAENGNRHGRLLSWRRVGIIWSPEASWQNSGAGIPSRPGN